MVIGNSSLRCIWASSGSHQGLELAGRTRMLNPCSAQSIAMACPALAADGQPTDIPIAASYKGEEHISCTCFQNPLQAPLLLPSWDLAAAAGLPHRLLGSQGCGHGATEGPGLCCSTAQHCLSPGWALLSFLGMAGPTASEDTCLPAVRGELKELGDLT